MAELDIGIIIVIALGSILVVLLLLFMLTSFVVMRKKRLLCFKRNEYHRPFRLVDREPGRHWRKSRQRAHGNKNAKKGDYKYQSISRALRFPKRDPFASSYLENPMVDMEELNTDWTNPAFDKRQGQKFDAAIAIQSWYRMIRYA